MVDVLPVVLTGSLGRAQGLTNAGLAEELPVRLKTVDGYLRNIFMKLNFLPREREHRSVLAVMRLIRSEQQ